MTISVTHIRRYPVKGLSPDEMEAVDLVTDLGMPWDRRFALAHESTRFDPEDAQWLPKTSFLMLMRNARLAKLETRFDEASRTLTIYRQGRKVVSGDLGTPVGRAMIEDFFSAYLAKEAAGKPRLVEGPSGHMFSDHKNRVLSLISLDSIRDLERVVGRPIDPVRFRGNLYLEGGLPWQEFSWVGKEITVGGVRIEVTARIDRCAATNVDPATGERDMNIPNALKRGFGHIDFGVYARVVEGGRLSVGDTLSPSD